MLTQTQNAGSCALMAVLALTALALGAAPLLHNPWKRTHRAFALFAATLGLSYAADFLGLAIPDATPRWAHAQTALLAFVPVLFCQFVVFLPHQRFEGSRMLLAGCYLLAVLAALPESLLTIAPLLRLAVWAAAVSYAATNLWRKRREALGVHRRQLTHLATALALTVLLGFALGALAPTHAGLPPSTFAPAALILLAGWSSVLLVRYHLPDVRWVLVRIGVAASFCAIVAALLLGMMVVGDWLFREGAPGGQTGPMLLAALAAALAMQPLKEMLEGAARRYLLHPGFDAEGLTARINRCTVSSRNLEHLLGRTAEELCSTLQARWTRVWLCEPDDADTLVLAYAGPGDTPKARDYTQSFLLGYLRDHPEPLVLERLVQRRPTEEVARVAQQLAEFGAYLLAPLPSRQGLIGFIGLGEKRDRDIYTREEVRALESVATPLAQAIECVRLHEDLREINRRLEGVLAAMRGGVVALDAKGRVSTINLEAQRLLGRISGGAALHDLPAALVAWIRRAAEQRRSLRDVELTLDGPDGEAIPVALSVTALEGDSGAAPGMLIHIYDMSEIKRLESTVHRADRLKLIGTLAAGMAHEIKNPLQSIKTFSQLLLDRFDDPDFRSTYAEVVPPEVQRIDTIVSRLLHFARPQPAVFAPRDVRAIIDHVLALVAIQLHKNAIAVGRHFPEGPLMVHADETQLHQVFLNLVLNAIAAMEDSGERRLNFEAAQVHASLPAARGGSVYDECCVRIVVSDTGRGIPAEHLAQLFTPFFTTTAQGSGLGLAVVHGIVADHRGGIDVSSVVGVGTAVTVTLPAAVDAAP